MRATVIHHHIPSILTGQLTYPDQPLDCSESSPSFCRVGDPIQRDLSIRRCLGDLRLKNIFCKINRLCQCSTAQGTTKRMTYRGCVSTRLGRRVHPEPTAHKNNIWEITGLLTTYAIRCIHELPTKQQLHLSVADGFCHKQPKYFQVATLSSNLGLLRSHWH